MVGLRVTRVRQPSEFNGIALLTLCWNVRCERARVRVGCVTLNAFAALCRTRRKSAQPTVPVSTVVYSVTTRPTAC